jgi:hypothetical protein
METRAQRHLDGMTVNRDAMARDVLTLVGAIRQMQQRATATATKSTQPGSNFSDAFGNLFDDILKPKGGQHGH